MASVTLTTLTARSQAHCDMDNVTGLVTSAQWTQWINDSAYELWDLLQSLYDDELVKQAPVPTATVINQEIYTLPSDFHKLSGIDIQMYGTDWHALHPLNFRERNVYRNAGALYPREAEMRYWLRGTPAVFHILPVPTQVLPLMVWYVPEFTPFVAGSDSFNFGNGWEEYVAVDVAIKAMAKEEADTSELKMRKQALILRVQQAAQNRDMGANATIQDVNRDTWRWP